MYYQRYVGSNDEKVGVILMVVSKAFDTINYSLLLAKHV